MPQLLVNYRATFVFSDDAADRRRRNERRRNERRRNETEEKKKEKTEEELKRKYIVELE